MNRPISPGVAAHPVLKRSAAALALAAPLVLGGALAGCSAGGGGSRVETPTGPRADLQAMVEKADADFDARRYEDAIKRYRTIYAAANTQELDDLAGESAAMVAATIAMTQIPGTPEAAEGDKWMERAEELSTEQDDGAWTRVLLARGIRSWRAFEVERARGTFIYLYNYCFGRDRTPRAIQAAYMASLSSRGQEQLDWMNRAIQAARTTGNPKWEAPLWTQLARLHDERDEHEPALDAYVQARQLTGQAKVTPLARQRTEVDYGHGLWRIGRLDDARDQLEQANAVIYSNYIRRPSPEAAELLGTVLNELGEVYAALGRKDRARDKFTSAREMLLEAGTLMGAPGRAKKLLQRIEQLDAPEPDRVIPPKRR